MRILVTGGDGTMGRALRAVLPDALYLGRKDLDVRSMEACSGAIYDHGPSAVIHAAAITDHQCPDVGALIHTNIIGTQNMARAAAPYAKFVYLSTHYVYPGERGYYRETDTCQPIGTYAWTKYAGECAARMCPNHLIIRGSWYDYETRLRHWERNGALTDAWCSRERVEDAAKKIATLVEYGAWGTYNIGGPRRNFLSIALDEEIDARTIRRADLTLPYEFPRDSSVNTEKYEALVGV